MAGARNSGSGYLPPRLAPASDSDLRSYRRRQVAAGGLHGPKSSPSRHCGPEGRAFDQRQALRRLRSADELRRHREEQFVDESGRKESAEQARPTFVERDVAAEFIEELSQVGGLAELDRG